MQKKSIFNFGQKITISYFVLFLLFFLLLFPFVPKTVALIMRQDMLETSNELIHRAQQAHSEEQMIGLLKDRQFSVANRMSLLDKEGHILYDSHLDKLTAPSCKGAYATCHPEVQDAMRRGYGYSEKYSVLFGMKFAYLARTFHFENKTYVLRLAFPLRSVEQLSHKFEIGFLTVATLALLLFAFMTWMIITHLTRPIRTIINKIGPYQDGQDDHLPQIELNHLSEKDEFFRLAETLNKLSLRIQEHINSVTKERDTKISILESLREGIISTDSNDIIIDVNAAACEFLSLKYETIALKNISIIDELLSNALSQAILSLFDQIKTTSEPSLEKTLHLEENDMVDLIAVRNKGCGGVTISIQDRTSQHQVIQMGKQFIANASHELKTPITIIQGFTETLHEHPELSPEQRAEITERIRASCERMDSLVKSLLTLTEIENIAFDDFMEEVNLITVIQNCKHILQTIAPEAQVEIDVLAPYESQVDPSFAILAHPSLIELTIFNLFKNAAKYCNTTPKIKVRLYHKNDFICIDIEDNGIGIPRKDLEHIFDRFFRVDKARARNLGGVGLGLSIAKTILDKHHARISVQSKLGEGTTFTILFKSARGD